MRTGSKSWIKLPGTKLIGVLAVVGFVALGLFFCYFWLVISDRMGTFQNITAVADLNSDGALDVVIHNVRKEGEFTAFSSITLWIHQGNEQFDPHRLGDPEFGPGIGPGWASAAGDLDLDGDVDLLVFSGRHLGLLQNQGGQLGEFGRVEVVSNLGGDGQFGSVALGDLDNDGRLDGIVAGCCGRQFTLEPEGDIPTLSWVWINALDPSGSRMPQTSVVSALDGLAMSAIALGDLDGDDDLDLFAAVLAPGGRQKSDRADRVLINDGSGHFTDSGQRLGNSNSTAVSLGDLDGDGDLDALVGTERGVFVWINQDGTFALSEQEISGSHTKTVFLSDLDGDGDLDGLIARLRQAAIWWNDGQAAFTRSNQHFRYSKRHGLAVGDFNNDSWPDIFAAEYSKDYDIWFNQGDGTFR